MAIAGVAAFIQERTKLTFITGLWKEALPLNLLWTATQPTQARPSRNVPTWSWISIDGCIAHRLNVVLKERDLVDPRLLTRSESSSNAIERAITGELSNNTWKSVDVYISDINVDPKLEINSLVHNAHLRLYGSVCKLAGAQLNNIPHVDFDTPVEELSHLPVLSFENAYVDPLNSSIQLHGIVLRSCAEEATYERVGYFWAANEASVADVLRNIPEVWEICLV